VDRVDALVVGAGVVGLAIARALGRAGFETVVVEKSGLIGSETSSRNSEVIHAGLYYPPGTLKAGLCVRGRERLYDYCASRHIAHRKCGKLIVAVSEAQRGALEMIRRRAIDNGVDDVRLISGDEACAMEPELSAVEALVSPSTGIIDSHAFMLSLLGEAEDAGVMIAYDTEVSSVRVGAGGVAVAFGDDPEPSLEARLLVNAAGLDAVALAQSIEALPSVHVPEAFMAKGSYFTLTGRAPFSRLVYPAPEPGGLGVHLTLDLGGQVRFGPDVEWVEQRDYEVDPQRAEAFYAAIRRYWPNLPDGALTPGYTGIRPKIAGPGQPDADFQISGPAEHGVPGVINLFGIESPGLTASLAIAEDVLAIARG